MALMRHVYSAALPAFTGLFDESLSALLTLGLLRVASAADVASLVADDPAPAPDPFSSWLEKQGGDGGCGSGVNSDHDSGEGNWGATAGWWPGLPVGTLRDTTVKRYLGYPPSAQLERVTCNRSCTPNGCGSGEGGNSNHDCGSGRVSICAANRRPARGAAVVSGDLSPNFYRPLACSSTDSDLGSGVCIGSCDQLPLVYCISVVQQQVAARHALMAAYRRQWSSAAADFFEYGSVESSDGCGEGGCSAGEEGGDGGLHILVAHYRCAAAAARGPSAPDADAARRTALHLRAAGRTVAEAGAEAHGLELLCRAGAFLEHAAAADNATGTAVQTPSPGCTVMQETVVAAPAAVAQGCKSGAEEMAEVALDIALLVVQVLGPASDAAATAFCALQRLLLASIASTSDEDELVALVDVGVIAVLLSRGRRRAAARVVYGRTACAETTLAGLAQLQPQIGNQCTAVLLLRNLHCVLADASGCACTSDDKEQQQPKGAAFAVSVTRRLARLMHSGAVGRAVTVLSAVTAAGWMPNAVEAPSCIHINK